MTEVLLDCTFSLVTCFSLSCLYIASLYVWNSNQDRNHPSTIKRRFLSVFVMMFVSPLFLQVAINKETLQKKTLWTVLGLRREGMCQAVALPLLLTATLFAGPLCMQIFNGTIRIYAEPHYWTNNLRNLVWLKIHLVAPLSEEFTFRSCMLPLLLQCFRPSTAIFLCPFFFGLAHFHHMIPRMKQGFDLKTALFVSCFQFCYTTLFGIYSAYIFYRTGHFLACFAVHAFCNHMGFPDVNELTSYEGRRKFFVIVAFLFGFVSWCFLLRPLTEPNLYHNAL